MTGTNRMILVPPGKAVRAAQVLMCLTVGLAAPAWSQTAPLSAIPQGSPLPQALPQTPPKVSPGLSAPAAQPLGAVLPGAQVNVSGVDFRGVTAYPAGHFDALVADLTGLVDLTRIEQARAAIVAAYRADGYVFTAVSASLEAGRLVFAAVEGRIVDVKLDGDIGPAGVQVLRFLNRLTETVPLDIATLERWLLLAQDVPGVTLRTVLRPSVGDPGALSLVAQVSRRSFSGLATADNRGFSNTGPEQILTQVSANSFTEYGERTDATFFYTARSTDLFGQISTEWYIGASGLKVKLLAGRGTNDPTGALGNIGYHGDTLVIGAQMIYPLIRERTQSLNLNAFFDALQGKIDTHSSGVSTLASQDHIRTVRLGADYALRDVLFGPERSAVTIADLRLSKGVTGLGASRQGDKLAGRVGERIGFTKVSLDASRTQTLFSPTENSTVSVLFGFAGQYSEDVLPPSEEFYLGGSRLNRGFYSGQVTGDRAMSATVEPQFTTSFLLPDSVGGFNLGTQFYGFYDWGETWQSQKADNNARVQSAGLGVRLYFPQSIELDLEAVNRLTRRPQGAKSNVAALPHDAFYWRLIGRF